VFAIACTAVKPPAAADSARSVVLDQVTNGVSIRMAVLYLVLGTGGRKEGAS
jgi:aspartate carbamoyltransferase catalytic subunit